MKHFGGRTKKLLVKMPRLLASSEIYLREWTRLLEIVVTGYPAVSDSGSLLHDYYSNSLA